MKMLLYPELLQKYNVAAPRYTSYPTVPAWDTESWTEEAWLERFRKAAAENDNRLSLYIHLPFCESLCTYCGCHTRITKNHAVEQPYINAVLKEWQLYKKQLSGRVNILDIHLGGGTPTFFHPQQLRVLVEGLLENNDSPEDAAFSFEAHPANTLPEHLATLHQLGFRRLSLGIQDFDPEVQQLINRHQTPADVIRVMQTALQTGYTSINFDLIYGLPLQKETGLIKTLHIALAMKPDRIAFYSYAHVPWMKPGQSHFTEEQLPTEQEKMHLYRLGREQILAAGYEEIGMDHFALPSDTLSQAAREGHLHRNFMGYTDRASAVLLGLGVSSISDCGNAFAQNLKKVEDYQQCIEAGTYPLMKGHLHHSDDLQIREQIRQLMCRGELDLNMKPLRPGVLEKLETLLQDDLIRIQDEWLNVTETGHSFLRNICMAFDERRSLQVGGKPSHSNAI